MQDIQTWQRSLSRVVLGLLFAGAVYLLAESLGFGNSQKSRQITFLLPTGAISQVEVTYLSEQGIIRQATLPVKGVQLVTDSVKLLPGQYELQILLRGSKSSAVSQRTIQVNDEEQLSVDLSRE
jgi:cell division protein YceG involved in septum cleavage